LKSTNDFEVTFFKKKQATNHPFNSLSCEFLKGF